MGAWASRTACLPWHSVKRKKVYGRARLQGTQADIVNDFQT
jgi:hypothetical protein